MKRRRLTMKKLQQFDAAAYGEDDRVEIDEDGYLWVVTKNGSVRLQKHRILSVAKQIEYLANFGDSTFALEDA